MRKPVTASGDGVFAPDVDKFTHRDANALVQEISNVITSTGVALNESDSQQLQKAIEKKIHDSLKPIVDQSNTVNETITSHDQRITAAQSAAQNAADAAAGVVSIANQAEEAAGNAVLNAQSAVTKADAASKAVAQFETDVTAAKQDAASAKNAAVGLKLPAVTDNNVLLVRDYRVLGGSSAMQQNDRFIKWL